MSVYVDTLFQMKGKKADAARCGAKYRHYWCHMWADTEEELHAMAEAIGMKRAWFQDDPRLPHYDLVPPRRRKAVKLGAIEVDTRALIEAIRLRREETNAPPSE